MGKVQQTEGPYWSKAWIQKLWEFTNQNFVDFDSGAVDFEALGREEFEFRKAMFFRNFKNSQRAKEAFDEAKKVYEKRVKAGEQGGRPRNSQEAANGNAADDGKAGPSCNKSPPNPQASAPVARSAAGRGPRTKLEFETFIYEPSNNINTALAWEWYDIHKARNWTDKAGAPLTNWKGALINYCKAKEADNEL